MSKFKTKVILLVDPVDYRQHFSVLGVFTDFSFAYKKLAEIRSQYPNSFSITLDLSDVFSVTNDNV